MKNLLQKGFIKYLLAFVAFVFISYAYAPQVLKGKIVNQSDISSWEGMSNEIVSYNKANPDDRTLWTNSMFGGMPATSISVIYSGDYTDYIYKLFFTGERPASYLLISLVGGFLLMLAFGVNFYLAILGAIAITFCSYNMQIIQVGHNSKMVAIAFMPWVLAAVVYAYRKCAFWGGILFAFALSFQIKANHPQISYYLAIIILGFAIWQFCAAIKERTLPDFIKKSLVLLVAGLLGIATNTNHLLPTYEYAQHTMRGGTELSAANSNNATSSSGKKTRSGLDLEYATQWSYGIEETANLLIPNFNGGSSTGSLDKESNTYKALKKGGYQGANQIIEQLPLYWGPQPFTAGPMYMGAISIFLFVLGFFLLKGGIKWWIGGVSLLALLLGWGYHCMPVSEFFFNWVPMYNKFRTVSMILVILQITIPVLAVITVNEILFGNSNKVVGIKTDKKQVIKGFCWATALTAGVALVFALIPTLAGSFVSSADNQLPGEIASALAQDRIGLLRADAFRSIIFILLGASVLWFGYRKNLTPAIASVLLVALTLVDFWSVDKRYLNNSHFVTKREFKHAFEKRAVDNEILKDTDPHYRVLDLSVSTFNDAYVSYHHKTIGGYSPAKLQRYQDLIDYYIAPEIAAIANEIEGATTLADAYDALTYHPVISMLNAKYIVLNANIPPLVNPYALGNAWFASSVVEAKNADEEIALLQNTDPSKQAIIAREFTDSRTSLKEFNFTGRDTSAAITLKSYAPNKLVYSYSSKTPQIALFSEVYYAPGWEAALYPANSTTDKKELGDPIEELEFFRSNWILRGLELPAGEYDIVCRFNPPSFSTGETVSVVSSGILILLLVAGCVVLIYRKRKGA